MIKPTLGAAILAIAATASPCAFAQAAGSPGDAAATTGVPAAPGGGDEVIVTARKVAFAVAEVSPAMIERQSALTSVNDLINELPGVSVQEGDAFGSSDWATSISIRGFNSGGGSDSQQIGTTIDGLPNGGSGYGGGSRANRYVDVLDIATVRVSQGTADISSRSNEALGGTLDYVTSDPLGGARLRVLAAGGDYGARKVYVRADTGTFAPDTRAFLSAASSYVRDWIGGSGETRRQHLTAKLLSRVADVDLTGFTSYDESDEAEFGSIAPEQFAIDPNHDAYTDHWTGLPHVDQAYRAAQRGARRNLFGYLKARTALGPVKLMLAGYYHRMRGQGDFAPPYIVDVHRDGAGQPESELIGGAPVVGGSPLGKIYFVAPSGAAATLIEPCAPMAGVPEAASPSCYPVGSTAVMSYRHTHYRHDRAGTLVDADWAEQIGAAENHLRAGFWFEHDRANHVRDFHRVLDPLVGPAYDHRPYYIQFSTDYALDEVMYYAEDAITIGPITARAGAKQFFLDQRRDSLLGATSSNPLSSRSRPLLNAGATYAGPLAGLELFAGYSQNFAAIPQGVLDKPAAAVRDLQPETANNIELGARYDLGPVKASLTGYDIRFKNQIVAITSNLVTGIDYLSEQSSVYRNVGGVRSRGVEAALGYRLLPPLTVSGSYTFNHATYIGTGNAAQDEDVGVAPGQQVINSPRRMWTLSADYRPAVVRAGVAAKFVGDRNIDTRGKSLAGNFTLLSGYVGADLGAVSEQLKGVSFTVQGTNLTDARYLAGADGGSAFLGTARTVTASLTLDF